MPDDGVLPVEPAVFEELNRRILRPIIQVVSGERHIAADQGISSLVTAKTPFYQRNRKIVRVALVKAKTSGGSTINIPGIVQVDMAMLERELGHSALWQRWDARKKDFANIDPPRAVAEQILSMAGEWPFPPLYGIIECPTLRPDGSLLDQLGYDDKTGLVLVKGLEIARVDAGVRKEDAEEALDLLRGLLAEFPFVDEVSKSVALSMFITPVVRGAMEVAPMHLVTKPLPGSGASYLLDCAAMIATGEVCAVESMAPKYEETEKRLIGAAINGFPIIGIDNVRSIVAGDFLCQLTERPLMSVRPLGTSEKARIANTFTIFGNGNNVPVAEDMVRRTLHSRLDANTEHPESREFSFDPLEAIKSDRGKYIKACLTIPLAYINEGRPRQKPLLPSYRGWSRMVRDPLVWLGCADPVASQDGLRQADPRKERVAELFAAWKAAIGEGIDSGLRTSALIDTDDATLKSALLKIAGTKDQDERKVDPNKLGHWLRRHEGHIAIGVKLQADREDPARPKWYLN
jgi:putative DNA primase/helicase